uniref:Uncharacterized protein n=1 Tax=Rhizophora mucronata TaxID=61149 RepID=A0A2P2P649_RHIMU
MTPSINFPHNLLSSGQLLNYSKLPSTSLCQYHLMLTLLSVYHPEIHCHNPRNMRDQNSPTASRQLSLRIEIAFLLAWRRSSVQVLPIAQRFQRYFPDDFQILPSSDITMTVTSS